MSDPLRSLADAARAVTAAATDDDVLAIVAKAARDVIGARQGVARRDSNGGPAGPRLVTPLIARDGTSLGMIELWDKDTDFTPEDEAIVIQLAQMAANAIETLELLKREHAARVEAEETGRRLLREKQRAEALQRVGSAIAGRLDLREIVQLATDAARELTPAAFGAFFYNVISDAGEAYMLYTLSGVDRSAFERFPMPRNTEIFGPTFNGEGVVRLDDVRKDPRYGRSAPYHGMPEGHLPVRSYLAVPVVTSDGEVAGGLFFGHPEPGMFSDEDEHMVAGIAAQSAIAIENARLYQERTRTAQTLQRALLPPHLPQIAGLELAASYRAAGEGNEVGGDFYDVFRQSDGSWALVVGDVCGKGPQAAAVTALARYTLRAHAVAGLRPSYLLARLNDALLRQRAPGFVTVALARLEFNDEGARIELTTAGHPLPIAWIGGHATPLGDVGTPLGIIERPDLPEVALQLAPGDLLAFYTDGVTEAAAPRLILTEEDLGALVAERAAGGPGPVVAHLEATAVANAGGNPRDDIACLAVQVTARPRVSERFAATPHAARDVAAALAPLAEELGPRLAQDLRLLATELVANAVRHTGVAAGTVEIQLRLTADRVHLSVLDEGTGFELPERPVAAPEGPGGWGLYLVDRCAVRWGAERGERHRMWLELERADDA
ncbi:SpoIIE family protein phosphatase [Solirubrobacter ginsenosidimutans]|uniref:SpoIIE family protein phosphatase n=1 Tax=Solirubrobacter ginsenosidimutans TaxID=490573 RepID=A0A9X3MXY8_9ACTN|nr:SpoIIE family protein phosphatase [Solirubrobacter ginsenosidimutans]MDA0163413.1 SpoIIE family protein phosphatase [Solirubrobacter ginsenosidimutans]